jgi:hypothetical protein
MWTATVAPLVRCVGAVTRCRPRGQRVQLRKARQYCGPIRRCCHPARQAGQHRHLQVEPATLAQPGADVAGQLGHVLPVVGPQDVPGAAGLQPQRPLEEGIHRAAERDRDRPAAAHVGRPLRHRAAPGADEPPRTEQQLGAVPGLGQAGSGSHDGTPAAPWAHDQDPVGEPIQSVSRIAMTGRLSAHDAHSAHRPDDSKATFGTDSVLKVALLSRPAEGRHTATSVAADGHSIQWDPSHEGEGCGWHAC